MDTVYLLHFEKKLKHAQHYIGYTSKPLEERLSTHRKGNGSSLVKAFLSQGIDFVVARVWEGKDGNFERSLKNRKKARLLCPVCKKKEKRC